MPEQSKAAFLDRDGVINEDLGYVSRAEDFHFIKGVFEACKRLHELGYKLIVVTNQAGIGRAYFTEADFQKLNNWMLQQFVAHGAPITAVYYCPYHPQHGVGEYQRESGHRKPGPNMLLDASAEHDIVLQQSFLVGDKASDLQAAQAAGVARSFYIGDAGRLTGELKCTPAYESLYDLVQTEFGFA